MEVHHHPHLDHKEKPWKEYLLEGLMIFLAVSMGFIAENIREHLSEQSKKKELIEMVELDFERDLIQLEYHKGFIKEKIQRCDSLMALLDSDKSKVNEAEYYRLISQMQWWWFFNSNNKSRNEADSKGYLSSVQNSDLAYSILKYDFFNNDYKATGEIELKDLEMFKKIMPKITDHKIYDKYSFVSATFPVYDKKGVKEIDPQDILTTKYILSELKHENSGYLLDIDSMRIFANKAIENIKKQYH